MKKLAKSSLRFTIGTMGSRVTGMLRESVLAAVFGASSTYEAFVLAFRIPNLLRDMLAEGALGSSFTKVYSTVAHDNPARAKKLFADSLWLAFLLTGFISILGMYFAKDVVGLLLMLDAGKTRGPEFVTEASYLTMIMFPFLIFASLGAIASGLMHYSGQFMRSAISPVAFNLANIIGALAFAHFLRASAAESSGDAWWGWTRDPGIIGLAIGVLLGGALQLLWQLWGQWRDVFKMLRQHFRWVPVTEDTKRVLKLMLPMIVAASAPLINPMVNMNFATQLEQGTVAWLNYAFRLYQLPVGIFSVAVGSVALPSLTRAMAASGNKINEAVSTEFQQALELVVWLMLPCSVFLALNAELVVRLLYGYGNFTQRDVMATAAILSAYNVGLIAYGLTKVLTSFYYAMERTKFAMYVGFSSIILNIVGNYLLVDMFGYVGLALTSGLLVCFNVLLLFLGLRGKKVHWQWSMWGRTIILLAGASAVVWLVQSLVMHIGGGADVNSSVNAMERTLSGRVSTLLTLILSGSWIVLGFFVAACLRMQVSPLAAVSMIRRKLKKTPRDPKKDPSEVDI